jgi:uncharacterized membrane protein (DUF2068 family)
MSGKSQTSTPHLPVLRTVAAFEFTKGLLVVLAGSGLISLIHRNVNLEDVADNLLYVLHLNSDRHLSQVFVAVAARLDDANLMTVAVAAALYCALRFAESYGLWNARAWAQWFALLSGIVYLPLEIYELIRRSTALRWVLLSLNVAIVTYMAYVRVKAQTESPPVSESKR